MERLINYRKKLSVFTDQIIKMARGPGPDLTLPDSILVFMEHGSMKHGSLSRELYTKLINAYRAKYEDKPDHEAILGAITVNFHHEVESAWQSFLAEIDAYDDE
jgi:hypothetical protein